MRVFAKNSAACGAPQHAGASFTAVRKQGLFVAMIETQMIVTHCFFSVFGCSQVKKNVLSGKKTKRWDKGLWAWSSVGGPTCLLMRKKRSS
jgi:hypothetical protein